MSNNAGRFDGQTAWRLAPATGRASETTYRGLTFCVSFPILLRFGPETDGPRERPRFASGALAGDEYTHHTCGGGGECARCDEIDAEFDDDDDGDDDDDDDDDDDHPDGDDGFDCY